MSSASDLRYSVRWFDSTNILHATIFNKEHFSGARHVKFNCLFSHFADLFIPPQRAYRIAGSLVHYHSSCFSAVVLINSFVAFRLLYWKFCRSCAIHDRDAKALLPHFIIAVLSALLWRQLTICRHAATSPMSGPLFANLPCTWNEKLAQLHKSMQWRFNLLLSGSRTFHHSLKLYSLLVCVNSSFRRKSSTLATLRWLKRSELCVPYSPRFNIMSFFVEHASVVWIRVMFYSMHHVTAELRNSQLAVRCRLSSSLTRCALTQCRHC